MNAFRLSLVIAALIGVPQHVTAAETAGWQQQAPVGAPAVLASIFQLQCPSIAICYGVGNPRNQDRGRPVLEKTTDGGASWTAHTLEATQYQAEGSAPLACPTTEVCYLVAHTGKRNQRQPTILITRNGGRTWTTRLLNARCPTPHCGGVHSFLTISCPTAAVCYVITALLTERSQEGELFITRDGGATWSHQLLVGYASIPLEPKVGLACPNRQDCYLSGLRPAEHAGGTPAQPPILVTHNGGQTWTGAAAGLYNSISCPAVDRCYAAGDQGLVATDDAGRTWVKRTLPVSGVNNGVAAIACPAPALCYIVDVGILSRSTDGGRTWTKETGDAGGAFTVACPAPNTCYAASGGGKVVKTTDGRTWRQATKYSLNFLYNISCPSITTCYAVGQVGTVMATTDGGARWSVQSSPTTANLLAVTCPAIDLCLAGGSGVVIRTSNGGRTWSTVPKLHGLTVGPDGIRCLSRTICFAAGGPIIWRTTDGGRTWATVNLPKGVKVNSIACASAQRCVAVGGDPPCYGDFAVRRSERMRIDMTRRHPLQTSCVQHGWLITSADGGQTWRLQFQRTVPPNNSRGAALTTVACPTTTQCYAGGWWIWLRSTQNGQHWVVKDRRQFVDPSYVMLHSLSCTGPSTCWALASDGNNWAGPPILTTDAGKTWKLVAENVPANDPGSPLGGGFVSLSCPASTRCYGVGYSGLIMAYSSQ